MGDTAQADTPKPIWVNEQIDPCGILYACIATTSERQARLCHETFQSNLTEAEKSAGWLATIRTVDHWDDVPVIALKLS
ncbi:MAG: glycogen debranching protein [Cyanobacteria bacterium J06632_22]